MPSRVRSGVLALLEGGDLRGAAALLAPSIEVSVGSELDRDLEFAMCAVFTAYALSSPSPSQ